MALSYSILHFKKLWGNVLDSRGNLHRTLAFLNAVATLIITTFGIVKLGVVTLCITTFGILTLSTVALSIMKVSRLKLGIVTLSI